VCRLTGGGLSIQHVSRRLEVEGESSGLRWSADLRGAVAGEDVFMLDGFRMRLAQVTYLVRSDGWSSFSKEVLFLNRTAIVVEKDLSEVTEHLEPLATAKLKVLEIDHRMLYSGAYRNENQQLDRKELLHQDMVRTAKADEENYILYLRKAEEARISDALDRQRFSNVVVAEPAAVPFTPQTRWLLVVVVGAFFASFASVMVTFFVDRWDPSFRTQEEVEAFLGSPVVAAIPKNGA
jgi:hypothetical protein